MHHVREDRPGLSRAHNAAFDAVCVTRMIAPLELDTLPQQWVQSQRRYGKGFRTRVLDDDPTCAWNPCSGACPLPADPASGTSGTSGAGAAGAAGYTCAADIGRLVRGPAVRRGGSCGAFGPGVSSGDTDAVGRSRSYERRDSPRTPLSSSARGRRRSSERSPPPKRPISTRPGQSRASRPCAATADLAHWYLATRPAHLGAAVYDALDDPESLLRYHDSVGIAALPAGRRPERGRRSGLLQMNTCRCGDDRDLRQASSTVGSVT